MLVKIGHRAACGLNRVARALQVERAHRATHLIHEPRFGLELIGARFAARQEQHALTPDPVAAVARYLRHMAELTGKMLRCAVRAVDEADADLAREVLAKDKELDAEFATALRQLMSFVIQDHQFLKATIDTVFALKGLERIGDHAKNIAEQVLYMLSGESDSGT